MKLIFWSEMVFEVGSVTKIVLGVLLQSGDPNHEFLDYNLDTF